MIEFYGLSRVFRFGTELNLRWAQVMVCLIQDLLRQFIFLLIQHLEGLEFVFWEYTVETC